MKLFEYVKGLMPHIEKSRVTEDLRITSAELDQVAIPSYRVAAEHFKSSKMRSKANQSITTDFYRAFKGQGSKRSNLADEIYARLPDVLENVAYITDQVETILERDVIREGLTAKKVSLIRAAEGMSYISRYSVDLLNYLYINESAELGTETDDALALSPAQIRHVEHNITRFAQLFTDLGVPNTVLAKIILAVPDVIINDRTSSGLQGLYREVELDPLSAGYMTGFVGNPIYHVRLIVAEWQASRYKANKDKKKMLELRLLHLKMAQDRRSDPKLDQEIEYLQGRIDRIARYMTEVETSLEGPSS